MRRPLVATLVALAASALLATPARAYVRSRSPDGLHDVIWPDPRITITVQVGGLVIAPIDDLLTAATGAAAAWSDAALDSSVAFTVVRSDEAPAGAVFDHVNTISFRAESWDPPMYAAGELALTTVWTQGAKIVDTDTEINAVDPGLTWALLPDDPAVAAMSGDVDLQNALTHELGHVLGLDHPCYLFMPPDPPEVTNDGEPVPSCSDPALPASVLDATMYPSAKRGSIGERTLSPDEVLALHDLYPSGQAPVVDGAPASLSGGCAVAGEPAAPSGGGLALAVIVGIGLTRRRARAKR
jgi:MYXO-CTERM domain-containing protein